MSERTAAAEAATARQADSREAEILQAAARIFQRKGYAATTILDIANAVGLLKGSLYHYIDSKEDLLFRVIHETHRTSLESTKMKLIGRTAIDGIRTFIFESVMFVAEHPEQAATFYSEYRHLTGDHLSTIVALRNENEAILETLLRRAQEDGAVRSDIHPKLMTLHILGTITSLHNWYRRDGEWSPEMLANFYATLSLEGLIAPG